MCSPLSCFQLREILSLNLVFNGYQQKKLCITVMGIDDLLAFESRQENLRNNLLLYIVLDVFSFFFLKAHPLFFIFKILELKISFGVSINDVFLMLFNNEAWIL